MIYFYDEWNVNYGKVAVNMLSLLKLILGCFLFSTFIVFGQKESGFLCNSENYKGVCDLNDIINIEAVNETPFEIKTSCHQNKFKRERSQWYKVVIISGNFLSFDILPQAEVDYDFAVYKLERSCEEINGDKEALRSSFAYGEGATGLSIDALDTCENKFGDGYVAAISCEPGDVFYILVDNYDANHIGFTIDFSDDLELDCCFTKSIELGESQSLCGNNGILLDAELDGIKSYQWYYSMDNDLFKKIEGHNESVLEVFNSGRYKIEASFDNPSNKNETCTIMDEVEIKFHPEFDTKLNPYLIERCVESSNNGFDVFNLNEIKREILGDDNQELFDVHFYENEEDFIQNEIIPNVSYHNFQNNEAWQDTIYCQVYNKENAACISDKIEIQLILKKQVTAILPDDYKVCTLNNEDENRIPGIYSEFLLNSMDRNIIDDLDRYEVRYFEDSKREKEIEKNKKYTNFKPFEQLLYFDVVDNLNEQCPFLGEFSLIVNEAPNVLPEFTLKVCNVNADGDFFVDLDKDVSPFIISNNDEFNVRYFIDEFKEEQLSLSGLLNITKTIYYEAESKESCFRGGFLSFDKSDSQFNESMNIELRGCDFGNNDGFSSFDLNLLRSEIRESWDIEEEFEFYVYRNEKDLLLQRNEIAVSEEYFNVIPHQESLWVKITSLRNGACLGYGEYISLIVKEVPEIEVDNDILICLNESSNILSLKNVNAEVNYYWENALGEIVSISSQIDLIEEGKYGVYGYWKNGLQCYSKKIDIRVKASEIASITADNLLIKEGATYNEIEIIDKISLGIGEYEFALADNDFEDLMYQDNAVFYDVEPGNKVLYVKDKNGCGSSSYLFRVLGFSPFFTPNGDGYNDLWGGEGIAKYPGAKILVFDRYGRFLKTLDSSSPGWDGTFQGVDLPSDDYWFVFQQEGRPTIKGHFSLKR